MTLRRLLLGLMILALLGSGCQWGAGSSEPIKVGFDVDDTLLFSTPNFDVAKGKHQFGTNEFWGEVNGKDRFFSVIKKKTYEIVTRHREHGDQIYAITARPEINPDPLREFLAETYSIPRDHVFFEPDSKTPRIRALGLTLYYGDSDSDIEDAQAAGARGIRIQRSPNSSYRNTDGTPRKYHPGQYGEEIIPDSEE